MRVSPLLMRDSEAELILNYHLDNVGALTKRNGMSEFGAAVGGSGRIRGLFQFNDSSAGTNIKLAVRDNTGGTNGVIAYYSGGTWNNGLITDTAAKNTRFCTFVDYVFRTNGADVVASSANGSTWGTTNCPTVITPKFCAVFQDRVYVAHGGTSNRSRLWFSSLPSAGAITWDTANDWVDINPDDGEEITGLENNGNRLIIYKGNSMYRWSFGQVEPDRIIGVGTYAQESIKTNFDLGVTFFANPHGVYAYTTGRPKLISRKIQPLIDVVEDWADICAEVDDDHYYLSVGRLVTPGGINNSTTLGTKTYSNVVLVYHVSLDAWTMYTMGRRITVMSQWTPNDDKIQKIMVGTTSVGTVYQLSNEQYPRDGASTTSGYDINGEFRSKEYMLSYPQRTSLAYLDVFSTKRQEANVFYDLDRQDNFRPLGTLSERVSNLRIPVQECNSVRVSIMENSGLKFQGGSSSNLSPQFTNVIEGFNFEHEPKQKRDESASSVKRK